MISSPSSFSPTPNKPSTKRHTGPVADAEPFHHVHPLEDEGAGYEEEQRHHSQGLDTRRQRQRYPDPFLEHRPQHSENEGSDVGERVELHDER